MLKKKIKRQKGIAILYALSMCLIFSLMMAWSARFLINAITDSSKEFKKSGMAVNVARAGAEDAYFWFTQQSNQPVNNTKMISTYSIGATPPIIAAYTPIASGKTDIESFFGYADSAFFPKYNANPKLSETDDETIGLVRDIPLTDMSNMGTGSNSLWGHYEVKRQQTNNNETAITNMIVGNKDNNDSRAVHDISHLMSSQAIGSGNSWRIFSTGYIYRRNDFRKNSDGTFIVKYNQSPNKYVDQATASLDILRVGLNTDITKAAIILPTVSKLSLGSGASASNVTIAGGTGTGVYSSTGGIGTSISPSVTGSIPYNILADTNLSINPSSVFSINESDLFSIASVLPNSSSKTDMNADENGYVDMKIICAPGDLTFTPTQPLKGSGILYVKGNLKLSANSGSFFSGVIYVKGNLTIEGDNSVSGAIIMEDPTKDCKIGSSGTQKVFIDYSEKTIQNVQKKLASYRSNNFSFRVYDSNK